MQIHGKGLVGLMYLIGFFALLAVDQAVAKERDTITQDDHYLCLNTAAAGLNWTGGKWIPSGFHELGEFQLEVMIVRTVFDDGTKHNFIHFTRNGDSGNSHCGMEMTLVLLDNPHCFQSGETITFSKEQLRGGISMLLGSTGTEAIRDSLVVLPFTCQRR